MRVPPSFDMVMKAAVRATQWCLDFENEVSVGVVIGASEEG